MEEEQEEKEEEEEERKRQISRWLTTSLPTRLSLGKQKKQKKK